MTHTPGPWKLEACKYSGSNWLVGSIYFGRSREDDKEYWAHITTDHVHASEMGDSDAKGDAELWVTACNSHDDLLEAAKAALIVLENFTLDTENGNTYQGIDEGVVMGKKMQDEVVAQLRAAIAKAEPES